MTRLLILATLCLASPALSETKAERQDRCTAQARIVELAVEQRSEGRRQARASKRVAKQPEVQDGPYGGHVDLLVNWVYTLPEGQVGPDAVSAFQSACADYKG